MRKVRKAAKDTNNISQVSAAMAGAMRGNWRRSRMVRGGWFPFFL